MGGDEVIRSQGLSPHDWDKCPYQRDPRSPACPFCHVIHSKKMPSMSQEV